LVSPVAGLHSERYKQVRDLLESCSTNLCTDPPNYKQAWRATLSATEVLFGLMFPHARLTADQIDSRLQPVIERAYQGDQIAQKAARGMLASFKEWVEASQNIATSLEH
jgi:hypothetical protein